MVAVYIKSRSGKLGATTRMRQQNLASDLCAAACEGDVPRLRSLVKEDQTDINLGDYDQRRALHLAASEGLLPTVEALLTEMNADPNVCDRWGNTPLDDAIRCGHDAVADRLRRSAAKAGASYVGNSLRLSMKKPSGKKISFAGIGDPASTHETQQSVEVGNGPRSGLQITSICVLL